MLRNGSRGDEVKALQTALTAAGFDAGTADGIFGPKTDAAVRAFQESKGLGVDGIVGPKTMAALESAKAGRPEIADRDAKTVVEDVADKARSSAQSMKDKFAEKWGAAREKAEEAGSGSADGPQ